MTGRSAEGVASVTPASPRAYVSNYIPLWAGLMADDSAASTNILQSFLASGRAPALAGRQGHAQTLTIGQVITRTA